MRELPAVLRTALLGVAVFAGACSHGDSAAEQDANIPAAVTVGNFLQALPVQLSVQAVPTVGPTSWDWLHCGRPMAGLQINVLVPGQDPLAVGLTDHDGFVEFNADPGTYAIEVNDSQTNLVVWNELDSQNPATTITVQEGDRSFFSNWFPPPQSISLFVLSGEDHCPTCDELADGTVSDCLGNVYRWCDSDGTLHQLDCGVVSPSKSCVSESVASQSDTLLAGCQQQ
jgi:hypothetical protein